LKTRGVQLQSMVYGHVAVAALDKAEGSRMEERSEDRVQEPTEDLLGDSVFNPGDRPCKLHSRPILLWDGR
jgi:hypothetical protein